jgi:hypothetical protein
MKRQKLTDNHPDMIKLRKAVELLDELQIYYNPSRGGPSTVVIGDNEYDLCDMEDGEPIDSFPPQFEYKLLISTS